jgi:hypothetical protein
VDMEVPLEIMPFTRLPFEGANIAVWASFKD